MEDDALLSVLSQLSSRAFWSPVTAALVLGRRVWGIERRGFETARDAREKLFDSIEDFYNQQRVHSAIGCASQAEFEREARVMVA